MARKGGGADLLAIVAVGKVLEARLRKWERNRNPAPRGRLGLVGPQTYLITEDKKYAKNRGDGCIFATSAKRIHKGQKKHSTSAATIYGREG